jgi:hypothetical protein
MKRGKRPQDQGDWRVQSSVPTSGDRISRLRLNGALPTGTFSLAPQPYRRQLGEVFTSVSTVTAGVQAALQFLAGEYLEQRQHAEARVQHGDWQGLFEFIGNDPNRLNDAWVQAALGQWMTQQIREGHIESVVQKVRELDKRVHPVHEADLRQVFVGIGEGSYQGYSNKYMFMHGSQWDPKREEQAGRGRAADTLKERFSEGRKYYWGQTFSLSFQYLTRVSGPNANVANVW